MAGSDLVFHGLGKMSLAFTTRSARCLPESRRKQSLQIGPADYLIWPPGCTLLGLKIHDLWFLYPHSTHRVHQHSLVALATKRHDSDSQLDA
jgi:hypothetical protein